jgi:hypothetical protein
MVTRLFRESWRGFAMEFAEQSASGSEQHFANMDEDVARPGGWPPAISMLDSYLELLILFRLWLIDCNVFLDQPDSRRLLHGAL